MKTTLPGIRSWRTAMTWDPPAPADRPLRLNIGCGRGHEPGFVNIDAYDGPSVDLVANLDSPFHVLLPYEDESCDEFLLSHVLEHIHHPLPLMAELHRVAMGGALCHIRCP